MIIENISPDISNNKISDRRFVVPILAYRKKIEEILRKFKTVEDNPKKFINEKMKSRKEFLISLAEAIERYFKDMSATILFPNVKDLKKLSSKKDANVLEALESIIKDKFDLLDVLIWFEILQDLRSINDIMTKVLELSKPFSDEVEIHKYSIDDKQEKETLEKWYSVEIKSGCFTLLEYFPDWRKNVSILFNRRKKYLTTQKASCRIGILDLGKLFRNADAFIFSANSCILNKLHKNDRDI